MLKSCLSHSTRFNSEFMFAQSLLGLLFAAAAATSFSIQIVRFASFLWFFEFRFASNSNNSSSHNSSLPVNCEPYWFRMSNYNSIEINSHFQHMLLLLVLLLVVVAEAFFFFLVFFKTRAIVFLVHLKNCTSDDGFFWSLLVPLLFTLCSLCGHSIIIWLYCFGFLPYHLSFSPLFCRCLEKTFWSPKRNTENLF